MIYIGVSAEKGRPFGIDDPCDDSTRVSVAHSSNGRQRVDDVPEGTWLDDQDRVQKKGREFRGENAEVSILSSKCQSLRQLSWQAGFDDLLLRGFEVVFHASLLDHIVFGVEDAIARAPVAITRLPDTANVDEIFFRRLDSQLVDFDALHTVITDEGHRDMGVPKKTNPGVLIGETGDSIEIVEDVAPLTGSIERRMHDREIAHLPLQAKIAQPISVFL